MISSGTNNASKACSWIGTLLFAVAVSLVAAAPAQAQATSCSAFPNGVLDGFVNPVPPSSIELDRNCTIRNFPASNPLTTNFNFFTQPGQTNERWLVIFDNVVHTGNMSCNATHQHKIWFTNGSSSKIQEGCQNLLIPVEKITKLTPTGQTTATIGVPFTYRLIIPVLFDPATSTVINFSGSPNDLHGITVWDNLNETGADLSYVGHVAYWLDDSSPVSHTFSNVGGLLTFDNIPIVDAGRQFVVELTVVLNDTPANAPGTQFVNTAKWQFGRLIDGVFYEPLPGEWGISQPLTIAAPQLVVTKSGPATMNLGQWGEFVIDVRNTGLSDAWDVSIRDLLPNGATGGMCDLTPEILSARVFAADGVTPVPGKGALDPGSDYTLSYSAAPECRLDLTTLTAAGAIGPNERLIVRYRTQLDDHTQNGVTLTNVAGAIQWYNGEDVHPDRQPYIRSLTDGTVGIEDHEDAHTVGVALTGHFFTKTVANLTSGVDPAATAAPGDTLRYTLRVRSMDEALGNFRIVDELDALNAPPAFVPGTLALVTVPPGSDVSATSSTGGAAGTGLVDVRDLNVAAGGEVLIQFDVTLASPLANGTIVTNQSTLFRNDGTTFAVSDDPTVNGVADPEVDGDEDPTRVTIVSAPVFQVEKISTYLDGNPSVLLAGERLRYTITVRNVGTENAVNVVLRDAVPVNTAYIAGSTTLNGSAVSDVGGQSPLVDGIPIHSPADPTPGSMPADTSGGPATAATITFDVVVDSDVADGTILSNQAFVGAADHGIADVPSDDPRTPAADDPTRDPVGNPPVLQAGKSGPATMNLGQWGEFVIDLQNIGHTAAWNVTVRDLFPDGPTGGMCDRTPEILSARVFAADGVTPVPGKGPLNPGSDYALSYSAAPACQLEMTMLTVAGTIGPTERLIVRYRTQLDIDTQNGVALTNVAGAIQWFNADSSNPARESYARTLTNGTVSIADHEDAHTVTVALAGYFFEKTAANLTTGVNPTTTAAPGDALRYTLRLRTDEALGNVRIVDELDALNALPVFVPGTLALVTIPPGADVSGTSSTGGAAGTGLVDIRSLNVAANGEVLIQFDVTLASPIANGTIVTNQSTLLRSDDTLFAVSDDPNVNGVADPHVQGDEDPTRVTIVSAPVFQVEKISTYLDGDPAVLLAGERLRYTITVKNIGTENAVNVVLRDAVPLNTSYIAGSTMLNGVAVPDAGGQSPLVSGILIHSPADATPGSMPADASSHPANVATVTFDVLVDPGVADGTIVSNQAFVSAAGSGLVDVPSDDPRTPIPDDPTLDPVGTPPVLHVEKSGPVTMNLGQWGEFVIGVRNIGLGEAWNVSIRDLFPDGPTGGMCDLTPEILSVRVFAADGMTPVPGKGPLSPGSDYSLSYSACQLDITLLTTAGTIAPSERLIVRYRTQLDVDTEDGVALTNVAGAIQWFNADSSNPARDSYARTLTNGTVGVADHEDAHTVTVGLSGYFFEKTAANLTTGVNPTTTATPGDTLRYTLRLRTDEAIGNFRIVDELDALNAPPAFVAGTLTLVTVPPGADTSATSSTGGAAGTGVVDIRNLSVPAGGEMLIQFDVTLTTPLANGTVVTNQSSLFLADGALFAMSDDPNVNGVADPNVAGDEDPTRVTIGSAPVLEVQKISTYLDGDPDVLLAGERLRYTITVRNSGNENAVNVVLRDAAPPVNTTYVAGSTMLNGVLVADVGELSALVNGVLIHSPADPTPGSMPTSGSSGQANVATITFDVVVDPDVVDGTIISNQAFVSAADRGIVDVPSDDPRTPIANDPTRDIVGNLPLLYAEKRVELVVDLGSPGIVDPGDVLRYTIAVQNSGAIPATGVVLTDLVPANTTYVANSTQLNGLPIGQPDGGVSPLASGIDISSSDLTPPLPGPGSGTISPGATAVLQFDVRVDDGTPAGTLISNQAVVASAEVPDLLTDGDGDPSTGPEPTVVVVGDAQLLSITKQVGVVGGGAAVPGAELEYVVRVTNIASVPALDVVITDDLDAPQPGQLLYVGQSATMNGSMAGVGVAGSTITADYAAAYGPLEPGEAVVLRFRATLAPGLAEGTVVTNTGVVAWNTPTQTASASVSIVVGGIPGVAVLSGSAWHDANFDDTRDAGERALAGWWVDLYLDDALRHSTQTDADGAYRIVGVEPNDGTGARYEVRFRAPGAGASTAMLGRAASPFTNGMQRIDDIIVSPGGNLQGLNLPIDPNGVIYNSITRGPVAGATLTLRNAGTGASLPAGCFADAAQQGQVTLADGYYKFSINFSDPACPSGGDYLIDVMTPPGSTYNGGYSQIIPPAYNGSTAAFSVPFCPGSADDVVSATPLHCEVQPSEFAPAASVPARSAGTIHHVHLRLDGSQMPGTSQIFNNHLPIDPELGGAIAISKTTPFVNVTRGQLVPYVITVRNVAGLLLTDVIIVDRVPAGFSYIEGSARIDGVPAEPSVAGLELRWDGLVLAGTEVRTVRLLLAVGAGVTEGEYVNRAHVLHGVTGGTMSGEATATVRVVPDPTFDCTDVIGKVFNDINRNGVQDPGEDGLPGVRLLTARGLEATTDRHGRYHITCAITPQESRGSNFVLKIDDRTLPSGFRMSTDPVQVRRVTRGRVAEFDFGASIHRVVGIDLSDAAFEPGTTGIRLQWRPRLDLLLEELRRAPAVLRLSYIADTEDAALVRRRMDAVTRQLTDAWDATRDGYVLTIEPEVFWRRGAPPGRPDVRVSGSR
jgi:uncharacterized repeat protein (TIGR01451 family)